MRRGGPRTKSEHVVATACCLGTSDVGANVVDNLVSLFVEEATEVAEEEPGETPELVAHTPKAKETP